VGFSSLQRHGRVNKVIKIQKKQSLARALNGNGLTYLGCKDSLFVGVYDRSNRSQQGV